MAGNVATFPLSCEKSTSGESLSKCSEGRTISAPLPRTPGVSKRVLTISSDANGSPEDGVLTLDFLGALIYKGIRLFFQPSTIQTFAGSKASDEHTMEIRLLSPRLLALGLVC